MSEELLILSVGDENHEPTPERIHFIHDIVENGLPEELQERYTLIVLPYYIQPFTTDKETLQVYDIDAEKLSELKNKL